MKKLYSDGKRKFQSFIYNTQQRCLTMTHASGRDSIKMTSAQQKGFLCSRVCDNQIINYRLQCSVHSEWNSIVTLLPSRTSEGGLSSLKRVGVCVKAKVQGDREVANFRGKCGESPCCIPWVCGRPELLPLHRDPLSSNCLDHLRIFLEEGASQLNFTLNARCTVINDFVVANSRTQKAFCWADAILILFLPDALVMVRQCYRCVAYCK